MTWRKSTLPGLALAGAALAGCAPQVPLASAPVVRSTAWSVPAMVESASGPIAPLGELLGNPELAGLIAQARANNPDIAIAAAQVARARAELTAARQASLPEVSATAALGRDFANGGKALDFRTEFARLDVSWELDLAGRISARRRAALARWEATGWERDAIALAIESEVARAWIQRAALAQRLAITDRLIARAAELERVVRVRENAGAATRVELGMQSIRLLELRRDRSEIAQSLDATRTALAVLTGAEAPGFAVDPAAPDSFALPALAAPPPPILLAARPDIRRLEAEIAAARGDVSAARASFFPAISLNAGGIAQTLIGGPLASTVSLGSEILAPIFARGRLRRDLAVADAQQVEAVETYRRGILAALGEVEDIDAAVLGSSERAALATRIVDEARLTARLANVQYLEGEEDLRNLIDAEELLGSAEDAQVLIWQERLFAQIALYSAIGGIAR